MRKTVIVLAFVALLTATATATAGQSLESAGRAALAAAQPDPSTARVRSMGRTWAGVAMVGAGSFLAVNAATGVCATTSFAAAFTGTQTCGQATTKFVTGAAVAGVGALFATIWSDVPAISRSVTFTPLPGGVRVGSSIGF